MMKRPSQRTTLRLKKTKRIVPESLLKKPVMKTERMKKKEIKLERQSSQSFQRAILPKTNTRPIVM